MVNFSARGSRGGAIPQSSLRRSPSESVSLWTSQADTVDALHQCAEYWDLRAAMDRLSVVGVDSLSIGRGIIFLRRFTPILWSSRSSAARSVARRCVPVILRAGDRLCWSPVSGARSGCVMSGWFRPRAPCRALLGSNHPLGAAGPMIRGFAPHVRHMDMLCGAL
jgi:hypothetical protein